MLNTDVGINDPSENGADGQTLRSCFLPLYNKRLTWEWITLCLNVSTTQDSIYLNLFFGFFFFDVSTSKYLFIKSIIESIHRVLHGIQKWSLINNRSLFQAFTIRVWALGSPQITLQKIFSRAHSPYFSNISYFSLLGSLLQNE